LTGGPDTERVIRGSFERIVIGARVDGRITRPDISSAVRSSFRKAKTRLQRRGCLYIKLLEVGRVVAKLHAHLVIILNTWATGGSVCPPGLTVPASICGWSGRVPSSSLETCTDDYIAQDSLLYGRQFTERLTALPRSGRMVPEAGFQDAIREVPFQGYRIIYCIRNGQHGARDLTGIQPPPCQPPTHKP
jgi:hypothetical protein